MIAGVMMAGWVVTFILLLLQPGRKELYDGIFTGLTGFYIPLVALLAACLPLGEEKVLNLAAWQLTLPVSVRRHWMIRLGTAFSVLVGLGLLLPFLLAWMVSPRTSVGLFYLLHDKEDSLKQIFVLAALLFTLSFWAINLVSNTIRAVLTCLLMLPLFGLFVGIASRFAFLFDGFETDLVLSLATSGFFSAEALARFDWNKWAFFLCASVLALAALIQSLVLFRRPESSRNAILKSLAILALTALILGFWVGDLTASVEKFRQVTQQ